MPQLVRTLLLVSVAVVVAACSAPPPKAVPNSAVTTESGTTEGVSGDPRVVRWLDIPYVQAPVGDLRWRAPRRLVSTDAAIAAQSEPVLCPQMPSMMVDVPGDGPIGNEDCLYLDVVAPSAYRSEQYPVMVWIHGGGNTAGTKYSYDFSELAAREQVIVVTLNYRLGPLGWMTHPALQSGAQGLDRASNFGTLDIISALGWVQRNIAQFGGDVDNVTVFGESAGGHNIYALLVSPLTEGLFHKAISQSGYTQTASTEQAYNKERRFPHTDRGAWEFVQALGQSNDTVTGAALRGLTTGQLIDTYYGLEKDHLAPLTTGDGIVVPRMGLQSALAHLEFAKHVPVMAGSNRDEVALYLGVSRYFVDAEPILWGLLPPRLSLRDEAVYDFWIDVRSRGWKARGVDAPLAALEAAGYPSLYAYRFDWDEQPDNWFVSLSQILGAPHGAEIAFLLGSPWYGPIGDYMYPDTESARAVSDHMIAAWGRFAREGNPETPDAGAWPRYRRDRAHTMVFDSPADRGVETASASIGGLLAEVADTTLLNDIERCILVWELLINIGQPRYQDYPLWNDGECAEVDAAAEKQAIRAALAAQYGSADVM